VFPAFGGSVSTPTPTPVVMELGIRVPRRCRTLPRHSSGTTERAWSEPLLHLHLGAG